MNEFIWLHYTVPRTAWYDLTGDERKRYERAFTQQRDMSQRRGAVFSGRFHVRGQSDYSQVEIWSFASAEDAFEHWSRLVSTEYTRYFEFANQLGTAVPADDEEESNQW